VARYSFENSLMCFFSESVGQVPLENNSIAQATLQWERNFYSFNKYPIIEEYRQHTFPDALSSIGGLLAILQGLHVLVFGRPLWWGLFGMSFCVSLSQISFIKCICIITGSKAVNPFGLFGTVSPGIREKIIARYGYIPNPTIDGDSATHKLGLFLSDFMLDVGPLSKDDEEMVQEEEGNLRPEGDRYRPELLRRRLGESAGVGSDVEMMDVLLERNATETNAPQ